MRLLSAFFALLILVPVLAFALSNRQGVDVALWPFDGSVSLPVYLLALVPLGGGLIVGALMGWAASVPHRMRARRLRREVGLLNERIDALQKPAPLSQPLVMKRKFWSRWS